MLGYNSQQTSQHNHSMAEMRIYNPNDDIAQVSGNYDIVPN